VINLEYLEKVKKQDKELGIEIDRIENNSYPNNVGWAREIAEELIKHNDNSRCIVTALENIDTTLNRR